jgi:hypothetical protein
VVPPQQPRQQAQRRDAEVKETRDATPAVVGELIGPDEGAGVEIGGEHVADFAVRTVVVSHGRAP